MTCWLAFVDQQCEEGALQSYNVIRYNLLWSLIGFTPNTIIVSSSVWSIIQSA